MANIDSGRGNIDIFTAIGRRRATVVGCVRDHLGYAGYIGWAIGPTLPPKNRQTPRFAFAPARSQAVGWRARQADVNHGNLLGEEKLSALIRLTVLANSPCSLYRIPPPQIVRPGAPGQRRGSLLAIMEAIAVPWKRRVISKASRRNRRLRKSTVPLIRRRDDPDASDKSTDWSAANNSRRATPCARRFIWYAAVGD